MDLLSNFFKMIAALIVVLGIMAMITVAARRFLGGGWGGGRWGGWRSRPLIRVLSATSLGPKKEIALIEVGKDYLVVGITPTQISLLTRLDRLPESLDQKEGGPVR
ncbi:MAG: flagellar biosynthetic protein FliO [Candidatus Manganitrophaceae bacterium]